MASKKKIERAEADLDIEKSTGIRAKLTSSAGVKAMRDRIAHLESEIAALDVQMSKATSDAQINSVVVRAKELHTDLQEAQTRLEEYTAQHESRN